MSAAQVGSLRALRHAVEYGALRAALAGFDRLSYGSGRAFARRLADLWWWVDVRRRRVAIENIVRSGVESDPGRARALSREATRHMGLVVVESLKSADLLDEERVGEHVTLAIAPDVEAILDDEEQGLIIASGHFGSWEIAAQLLSRRKPLAGITRPMNNPRVEALIQRRKPRYRFHPIPKYGANASRFLEVLDQGEILALLTDQHARKGGVMIPFFGIPAATYTTAAMLHLVTRTPLCFAACTRTGPRSFLLETSPLIEQRRSGDKKADVRAILETLNGYLEAKIRAHPEQYVWAHRRWRDTATTRSR